MITGTPANAPCPVDVLLQPLPEEQSQIALASCDLVSSAPCSIPVQVGLFFDGTNNNMERDLNGKRIGLPDPNTKVPARMPGKPMKPEQCSHSNVVRLYQTFPQDKTAQGYFRYYIPGVGTEFEKIGELTESSEGKAFAKGGQPRIVWGILQVLNAIHMTAYDQQPLYKDVEAGQLAQAYGKEVGQAEQAGYGEGQRTVMTHRKWFAPHLEKLGAALAAKLKPKIPSLRVSVFGFSRGAAEAAAFCHFFDDLLDGGKLAGIPADICFAGLFDTVASVGGSASVATTTFMPGALFDGHWSWAERILKPLPGCVKAGRHFIAAHEQRMNFPVTCMEGNIEEVYFPGVHSDVGGGYAPGEQGKGRGAQAALLSQIPLVHMFQAARLAGVPLTPFSQLEARDKIDFAVDAALASAWNAYTAELGKDGASLSKHMALFYRWRAARLGSLETTASFKAADAQEQQDLRDANRMLAGDLEALRARRNADPFMSPGDRRGAFTPGDMARINQWHFFRAQNYLALDEWEKMALDVFDRPEPLPPEVMRFFDDYVHDSFAGFYLAGEVTEYDRRKKAAEVMQKNPDGLKGFDRKVYELTAKTRAAQAKQATGEALTPEEDALVRDAQYGTPYPIMSDEDSADMRNPVITTQTATRREAVATSSGAAITRRPDSSVDAAFARRNCNGSPPPTGQGARRRKCQSTISGATTCARTSPPPGKQIPGVQRRRDGCVVPSLPAPIYPARGRRC